MIRVRFAPSPTGHLHVGGVRTALFNWIFARNQKGSFILRIEDTDTLRSTQESEKQIFQSLRWCGLDWDEGPDNPGKFGPYRQMERYKEGIYQRYVEQLIADKRASYAIHDLQDPKKIIDTTFDNPEPWKEKGHEVTVRFQVRPGQCRFRDLLKNEMVFENETIDDFIIMKSSGIPVYNFAAVVDDHLMEITHVVRGEDHISNTPRQLLLYEALWWTPPQFMHIPLLLGEDRTPLSKRHGGTSVEFFRQEGYLARGLMNYLALLGWHVEQEEVFSVEERISGFTLSKITSRSVIFDYRKLEWINGKHLRTRPLEEVIDLFQSWLAKTDRDDFFIERLVAFPHDRINRLIDICREKVNTFLALKAYLVPFLLGDDQYHYDQEYIRKYMKHPDAEIIMEEAKHALTLEPFTIDGIEKALRRVAVKTETSNKRVFQTIRGAVLGLLVTPGLFDSIWVLGLEKVIRRIDRTLAMLHSGFEG